MSAVPDDGPPTCADCGEVGVPPRVEYDDLQAAVLCVPCLLKRPDPDVGPTRHDADHTPWPEPMQETAFHGLAGEIVREIEPHSEADPAAILAQFLAGVGNAVGRSPGWQVEADRHFCNLFVAIVGDTSSGRKGTSLGQARRPIEAAHPEWSDRFESGLSSGEGLIWAVRDPIEKRRKARTKEDKKRADEAGFITELADLGVDDKRLFVVESELASVLERMKREGNTLSEVMRQAWDGSRLDTLVKTNQARASNPHISIVGHITADELRRKLTSTEQSNGFGNRWLWICAKRSKVLPFGGEIDRVDWNPITRRLGEAIDYGRTTGLLDFDQGAREVWEHVYGVLTAGAPGMFGAITARAAPQVRRLATIYALLDPNPDGVPIVAAEHLGAALAVWEYAEASARFLFGDRSGDPTADTILAELRRVAPEGKTRNEIRDLFGRHRSAADLDRALGDLESAGRVWREEEATGGRPSTRYYCAESAESAERVSA